MTEGRRPPTLSSPAAAGLMQEQCPRNTRITRNRRKTVKNPSSMPSPIGGLPAGLMPRKPNFTLKFHRPKGGRRPPGGGLNRSQALPRPEVAVHLGQLHSTSIQLHSTSIQLHSTSVNCIPPRSNCIPPRSNCIPPRSNCTPLRFNCLIPARHVVVRSQGFLFA